MEQRQIGLLGLGVMGSSLGKNLIAHGHKPALFSVSEEERKRFRQQDPTACVCETQEEFLQSLSSPKTILMMVTAGKVVDLVIDSLLPFLQEGDILIDGGNSFFEDTRRREEMLSQKGIRFLGVGISGGEQGALTGPSMMVGGSKEAWEHCKPLLQSIAAKVEHGESCCDYVGPSGAGHYIKMIHNGIEYGILQLIAEVYHIFREGLGYSNDAIQKIFTEWNKGPLNSYLIEITATVLSVMDDDGQPLIDKIKDVAKFNGTGAWTFHEAIDRGVYAPTIGESVFMRLLSGETALRQEASVHWNPSLGTIELANPVETLEKALLAGILACYAQGIQIIEKASQEFDWDISLPVAISLWRGGCIIRSVLLPQLVEAVKEKKENILLSHALSYFSTDMEQLRAVVAQCVLHGVSAPTLTTVLSYYDGLRTGRMSTYLVQGLRDCFGAHRYERIDQEGSFHTQWEA